MRIRYLFAGLIALIMIATSTGFMSSSLQGGQQPRKPNINKVINPSGWEIPGLAKSQIVTSRKSLNKPLQEHVQVYVTLFKPTEDVVFEIPSYIIADDTETLYLGQRRLAARGITKYDIGGQAFCYQVHVFNVVTNDKLDPLAYAGETSLFFYDDNGDGKFETFQQGGTREDFSPRIPRWILPKG